VFHYPVIRTERIDSPELKSALTLPFTHLIFTSKNGVRYWPGDLSGVQAIAIGAATAEEARLRRAAVSVAKEATQEGVASHLQTLRLEGAFLVYPRSRRARPFLGEYMKAKEIPHFAFDLYDTVFQKPEPVPNLADFDEIVFTAPSAVEGFIRIFSAVPERIALTPIGPITKKALEDYFPPEISSHNYNANFKRGGSR